MTRTDPTIGRQGRFGGVARALRHRNYLLFFFGQGTSLMGSWMQRVALGWLVYRLTGSEMLLGVVAFSGQILTFLVAPFAGVLADRTSRRGLLVATQSLATLQAFVLAWLTLAGGIEVWHIIALSMVLGLVNAFDIPTRQSFVVEMVGSREDLPNAIALNSFMVNGSRLIGPAAAGVLIDAYGEGACFLVNGVSFLAVIAALVAMRVPARRHLARHAHVLHSLREGLVYSFGFPPIRAILLLLATVSLLGMSYAVLLPVFARDILGGDSRTLGLLTAASAPGAVAGALFLASRRSVRGLGGVIAAASTLFGAVLIAMAYCRNLALVLGLLALAGLGTMLVFASCNSLLQTIVEEDKRGRVMSFYVMAFMGMGPFGGLLMGWLATQVGTPGAVMVAGISCVLAGALFAARLPAFQRMVDPIHIKMGLVPEAGLARGVAGNENGPADPPRDPPPQ